VKETIQQLKEEYYREEVRYQQNAVSAF